VLAHLRDVYQAAVPASIPDISVRELKVKIVADKRTTEEIKKRTGNNWNENLEVAARYFEATLLKDLTVEKLRTFAIR
jgi:hypothetical protein